METCSRPIVKIDDPIPLIGCIAFGCIDRGTNLIQVRPTSVCPLSCIFCSTNAGPRSRIRQVEYTVALDHMVEEFKKILKFKGEKKVEAHIDTVGDPLTYPDLIDLVSELSRLEGVETVSMQTHGSLLNEKTLDDLSSAGLTRINLSIDALDTQLAKRLADTEWYDVNRVIELAKYTTGNTQIDLLIAPLWVPSLNDDDIPKIVELASHVGAGRNCPPLGIQKYLVHKHGRKVRGVRALRWSDFYSQLKRWGEVYNVDLILRPEGFGIHRRPMLPTLYRRLEKVKLRVVALGWLREEKLAVTAKGDRVMTLINAGRVPVGSKVRARVVANKHNIYVAEVA